jgi:deazaflavin-dependent oxidoreductase (nitroreductase family)
MKLLIKVFTVMHVFIYRLLGGFLVSKMAGQSMLLLSTTGRRSGKTQTISISYFRDDSDYVLVASNWGRDHHPGWYHNLMSQPAAEIQVKAQTMRVCARTATAGEYERLWKVIAKQNPMYVRYQHQTSRKIPLVILEQES